LVDGVLLPVLRDDVGGDELLATLAGEADGEGALERPAGGDPPDGSPRVLHRHPLPWPILALHEVHLHDVAVIGHELHQHRQVERVRHIFHVEHDLLPRQVRAPYPA
jgi:hypothetical protein